MKRQTENIQSYENLRSEHDLLKSKYCDLAEENERLKEQLAVLLTRASSNTDETEIVYAEVVDDIGVEAQELIDSLTRNLQDN
jgi:hypothetical protein